MNNPLFVSYGAPNGVPQESKLATYMNRQSTSTPIPSSGLVQSFGKMALDSPTTSKKVSPDSPAFIPIGMRGAVPGATAYFPRLDSPQSATVSPHPTPHPSPPPPPPNGMGNCSPIALEKQSISAMAYQENVGGTTYFYPTTTGDSNVSAGGGDNSNISVGPTGGSLNSSSASGIVYHPQMHMNHVPSHMPMITGTGHLAYPGAPGHVATLHARASANSNSVSTSASNSSTSNTPFFISDDIRADLLNRNALTLMQAAPEEYPDLPTEVEHYHDLYPIEPILMHKPHLGYQATMYKATNIKTGIRYCLRRIHGFRLQNPKCMLFVDMWKKLVHSNIVQLKEVFTTKAFGDTSMIFVYDYHAGSETMLTRHFGPVVDSLNGGPAGGANVSGGGSAILGSSAADPFAATNDPSAPPRPYSQQKNNLLRHQQNNKLPEPLIWNYIIQLTSALRIIHSSGLACRSLDPTKIILGSGNRLRLSCLGVMDVIMHDPTASAAAAAAAASPSSSGQQVALVQHYQQEDLCALGKLVLALGCKSTMAVQPNNINTAIELVTRSYTNDLRNLLMYLLSSQQRRSVTDLMPMIGARFYTQLDGVQSRVDVLENEVAREMENGRLVRLMIKLGTINERPEFVMGDAWSETGDRYMLKLFRDYVFHQVTDDGHAWLDMAHIVQCLNKLDAGVPEKVCLMSRDEQSVLVVSYAELKHCLEQSFEELQSDAMQAIAAQAGGNT